MGSPAPIWVNPIFAKALIQHADYVEALRESGLVVTVLTADESYPDSTFVEDAALLTPHCSIITNPGAQSRNGEVRTIRPIVADFFDNLATIRSPATLDAGDVMMVANHYYIGLSERTNQQGAEQLSNILQIFGMTASVVCLNEVLHLKAGVSYLENNNLLACGEFLTKIEFQRYNLLPVDHDEAYAANSVWINDVVLTPKGFPKTRRLIESCGYQVREVDVSEFQKLDGGLSCLSLRF